MTLLAYHGKPELKKSYIDRLKAHREAEELVQGVGFEKNGEVKGCNIGCLFDYYDHEKGAVESGIPEAILRLADTIFEGLPAKEANKFAIEWPKAINPGANLERIKWKFCAFLMRENIERVLLLKIDGKLKKQVVSAIQGVLKLHGNAARTGEWDRSAGSAARSAAGSAAWSAAGSAAWSAAESAAGSAAGSAARSAAGSAARSAAGGAAGSAARSAAYKRYAKELIRLLGEEKTECPIIQNLIGLRFLQLP